MNKDSIVYTVIFSAIVCLLFVGILALVQASTAERVAAYAEASRKAAFLNSLGIAFKDLNEAEQLFNTMLTPIMATPGTEKGTTPSPEATPGTAKSVSGTAKGATPGTEKSVSGTAKGATPGTAQTTAHDKQSSVAYRAVIDGIEYFAVEQSGPGLWGTITIILAASADGVIRGIEIVSQNETPGLGGRIDEPVFKKQFVGKKTINWKITVRSGSEASAPQNSAANAIPGTGTGAAAGTTSTPGTGTGAATGTTSTPGTTKSVSGTGTGAAAGATSTPGTGTGAAAGATSTPGTGTGAAAGTTSTPGTGTVAAAGATSALGVSDGYIDGITGATRTSKSMEVIVNKALETIRALIDAAGGTTVNG
ncbi:MAG TPA: FMN-binding protein [Spirochaetales bacterium]|nr:FMN-binding protein [Spirochaetales bacterium]